MNRFLFVLFVFALAGTQIAYTAAQEDDRANVGPAPPLADTVAELDAFRAELFGAFNRGDYKTMLEQHCHPDVIATWQDGTSGQGYDAVLAEFEKLSKFIDKMTVQPDTDMRLIYTDARMVVASGSMRDHYALARGVDVDLNSRWTATLVKENDKWLLLSFSASTNAFQNEVISLYLRNTIYVSAAIAAVAGLIVGIAGTRLLGRRKRDA
jgi:hypothetical protein